MEAGSGSRARARWPNAHRSIKTRSASFVLRQRRAVAATSRARDGRANCRLIGPTGIQRQANWGPRKAAATTPNEVGTSAPVELLSTGERYHENVCTQNASGAHICDVQLAPFVRSGAARTSPSSPSQRNNGQLGSQWPIERKYESEQRRPVFVSPAECDTEARLLNGHSTARRSRVSTRKVKNSSFSFHFPLKLKLELKLSNSNCNLRARAKLLLLLFACFHFCFHFCLFKRATQSCAHSSSSECAN